MSKSCRLVLNYGDAWTSFGTWHADTESLSCVVSYSNRPGANLSERIPKHTRGISGSPSLKLEKSRTEEFGNGLAAAYPSALTMQSRRGIRRGGFGIGFRRHYTWEIAWFSLTLSRTACLRLGFHAIELGWTAWKPTRWTRQIWTRIECLFRLVSPISQGRQK